MYLKFSGVSLRSTARVRKGVVYAHQWRITEASPLSQLAAMPHLLGPHPLLQHHEAPRVKSKYLSLPLFQIIINLSIPRPLLFGPIYTYP